MPTPKTGVPETSFPVSKFLYGGCLEREINPMLIGIDMSKAFDTVDRVRLITQLEEDLQDNPNAEIVKLQVG